MKQDDYGDWRFSPIGRVAHDVSAAFPGGPSHKAGSPLYASTYAVTSEGRYAFMTPSTPAMCLHIAITSAREAQRTAKKIKWHPMPGPDGTVLSVKTEHTPTLFQYFQECMCSTVFSYIALEAFANKLIMQSKETIVCKVGKVVKRLSAEDAEKLLSTELKLKRVLPKLLNVRTPAGVSVWERFRELEAARDSVVHFKTSDQTPRASAEAISTLYFQFLGKNPIFFPQAAVGMMNHFYPKDRPRWLTLLDGFDTDQSEAEC